MLSEIDICNLALSQIRADNINSLDEGSLEAEACRMSYPLSRRFVLRDAPWGFAKEYSSLSLVDVASPPGWGYVYDYPNDCLRLLRVLPDVQRRDVIPGRDVPHEALEYKVVRANGRNRILSRFSPAWAEFIVDVEDPTEFDPIFVEALVWHLVSQLSVPVVGVERGRTLRNDGLSMYRAVVAQAFAHERNETSPWRNPESEFVTVR